MKVRTASAAGSILRNARQKANLTIAELAHKAKASPSCISCWENHAIPPTPLARFKIAAILGMPTQELFPGTDPLPWERTPAEDLALRKIQHDQVSKRELGS